MADEAKPATTSPAVPAAPAAKAAAPAPAKPAAKPGKTRRGFFMTAFGTWFGLAWTTFSVSMFAMIMGTVRFMFPNVLSEPPSTFKAGTPDQYEPGQVVERFKQEFGVWIVREGNDIFALSTTCTHLGCTPNWLEAEQKFKCPCHGSGFYKTGVNFEGPAPRPLERYKISIADDGQLLVDKTRKFQRELGQWSDPEAAITL
jgi:cytochrome b6-f complex iron-sulfur subunit